MLLKDKYGKEIEINAGNTVLFSSFTKKGTSWRKVIKKNGVLGVWNRREFWTLDFIEIRVVI